MHHGIYIYHGMYLAAILDSSRKGGNFFLFLNNYGSTVSEHGRVMSDVTPPLTPLKHPQTPSK